MRKFQTLLLTVLIVSPAFLHSQELRRHISADESSLSSLQKTPLRNNGSQRSIFLQNDREIEGNPYFNKAWLSGDLILADNKRISSDQIKLSLFTGNVHFMIDSIPYSLDVPVKEVWLFDDHTASSKVHIFRTGYVTDPEQLNTFVEVLSDGKIKLVKYKKVLVQEYAVPFENAKLRFATEEAYYLYTDAGGMQKVKPNKAALMDALPAHQDKINTLTTMLKTKFKSEDSFAGLIDALNREL